MLQDGSFQLELIEHATTAGSGSAAAGLKKIPWRSNTQQLQAATYAGTAGGADLGGRPQSSRPSTAPAASSGERGVARVSRRNAPGGGSGSGGNAGGGESENQQQPEDEGASTGGWGRDSGGARGRRVMPPLADCGVLASVRMAGGGRVVGTLGMEEELQRARLRGTVKKVSRGEVLRLARLQHCGRKKATRQAAATLVLASDSIDYACGQHGQQHPVPCLAPPLQRAPAWY
jgi:hypothetical protein